MAPVEKIELIIEYHFKTANLVKEALTPPSSYRFEFLGSSVIKSCAAKEGSFSYPNPPSCQVARFIDVIMDKKNLAVVAASSGLHKIVKIYNPLNQKEIKSYMAKVNEGSDGCLDPPKSLSGVIESLLGAVFLDSDKSYDIVWKIFKQIIGLNKAQIHHMSMIMRYDFKNKQLLEDAVTHPAYQTLTQLGNTIIQDCIANFFFATYPNLQESVLKQFLQSNIDKEKLARAAVSRRLYKFLRRIDPQLKQQIGNFIKQTRHPEHTNDVLYPPEFLGDVIESLLGAVFIDSNGDRATVWTIFQHLVEPLNTPYDHNDLSKYQIEAIESFLGYSFRNKKQLVKSVMTWAISPFTENLKEIGNNMLWSLFEGELTKHRHDLTEAEKSCLIEANFKIFMMKNGPLFHPFIKKPEIDSNPPLSLKSVNDVVLSLIGAIHFDTNHDSTVRMIIRKLSGSLITYEGGEAESSENQVEV